MARQGERRAQTREALLDAAATLFAERGVEGASIDAIAEAAGRTSGAVYDHFGSKDGLLFALLETWLDDVAAVIAAELTTASTLDERLAAVWHNIAHPPTRERQWVALEHELWSYATRNDAARERLGARYRMAWDGLDHFASESLGREPTSRVGPALVGTLLGLEMMRCIDPAAVTDEMAVAALRGVIAGVTATTEEGAHP